MESFEKSERTAEEWFWLGLREKDPEKQVKYYTKALEINPKYDIAWAFRGSALNNLGRYKEAIRCCDKALEIDPSVALVWNEKGHALNKLNKCEEAIKCFDKALGIDPKSAPAWHNKALTLNKLNRYEEAIECFDKALEINPKDVTAWPYKGDALLNLKRYKEAIRCCDKALEITPNFEEAKNNRKIAEEKFKKEKEAGLMWKMPFIPKKSRVRGLLRKEDLSIALEKFSSDRDLIPILIELLYDSNANVRKGAADNIGAIGANNPYLVKSAIPGLIKLLDDSNEDVRSQTANAIWLWLWLGGATPEWFKDAIPKLMNLLIDPSEDVRNNAAYALGKIGRKKPDLVESVIPTLIRLLDNPHARREGKVIDVIVDIGEENPDVVKDAFSKLINFLEDVHGHAIHTFMRIGEKRPDLIEGIAPKLINLLSDEQKIVSNAEVIGFLGQINLDLVKDVISKLKEFLNSSDKEVRENAVRAVVIIAERKPELVKDAFPRLIELLDDPDGLTRAWAASAITVVTKKMPELFKEVVPKLTELLDDSSVSYDAAIAIGNICGATRLVELLCDLDIREGAVSAIVSAIEAAAKKTPELFKDATSRLTELLEDSNFRVIYRMNVAYALGNICGAGALPHLEKLLEDNPEDSSLNYFMKEVIERINKRIETSKQGIESAERALEEAKAFGCGFSDVEDLLNKAKSSFYAEYHVNAIEYAREAEEIAKKIKEKSKPEIAVTLSECRFLPETWKKIEVFLANKGKAHAKELKIDFSTEIEMKGLQTISNLNVGGEKRLEVSLRPKLVGELPLDIKISYNDLDGREYTQRESFWINVALKEGSEIGIAEQEIHKLTIERTIYDPCKRDFIDGSLPRMKEWINRYDPGTYWFAISIQNSTDKAIEEWGVDLETSSALKMGDAKIEGIEIKIPHEAHLNTFKISVPMEYGIVIPKGGAQRVYFKLRAEKPKTRYEISGVFKSENTGEVPIRPKEFMYLCDAGSLRGAILEQPEAALEYVKTQVNYYSPAEVSAVVKGLDIVFVICRMCTSPYPKRADVRSEVEKLKGYLKNVEDKLGQSYNDFELLVREMDAVLFEETVPVNYAEKIKRKCLVFPDDLLAKLQRQSIERGG